MTLKDNEGSKLSSSRAGVPKGPKMKEQMLNAAYVIRPDLGKPSAVKRGCGPDLHSAFCARLYKYPSDRMLELRLFPVLFLILFAHGKINSNGRTVLPLRDSDNNI